MDQNNISTIRPRVVVIADVQSNATALVEKVLKPAGVEAWTESETAPDPDVLIVDVTQLMGDPLAGLRSRRSSGDDTPALILAARFPQSRLRDFTVRNGELPAPRPWTRLPMAAGVNVPSAP